jgi:hypothetical protein
MYSKLNVLLAGRADSLEHICACSETMNNCVYTSIHCVCVGGVGVVVNPTKLLVNTRLILLIYVKWLYRYSDRKCAIVCAVYFAVCMDAIQ